MTPMLTDPADLEILSAGEGVTTAIYERCFLTVYRTRMTAAVLEQVARGRRKVCADLGLHGLINIADPKFTGRKMDANTRRVMLEQTEEFSPHTACALNLVPGDGLLLALGREVVKRIDWLGGPKVTYPSNVVADIEVGAPWFGERMEERGVPVDAQALIAAVRDLEARASPAMAPGMEPDQRDVG